MHLPSLLHDAVTWLQTHYGDRLADTILYGSHARGEAQPDSDVDLLVVLHGDVNVYHELKHLAELRLLLLEQYGVYVSLQPFSASEYHIRPSAFLRTVHREGMPA